MTESEEKGKQSISEREEVVLERWRKDKVFEKTLEKTAENTPYVFYDGPPFATGLPHYGHLLAGTIKDIIPRYQTMRGNFVRREWGWDCHGLPLENLIEKELGLKHKQDIEAYGVENFNQKARESVLMYDKEWKEIIPRLGRWADMEKSYKTMDASYTESIWWSFKTLYDKGLIYEGYKSMHICPRCETTLAISEVGMNYKDIKDISVYVMFELLDEPETYMLAWTTTPWTLPGNVAVAVNPGVEYVKVNHEGKKYILAKERVENVFKEKEYVVETTVSAKDLVGKKYKPLFDHYVNDPDLANRENGWRVVGADFVTTDSGTGVVHEAPAFGEEDMELAKKLKLPMIQHVGMDGVIKPEVTELAGKYAKPKDDHTSTDVEVIKLLALRGVLFAKEKIEHSYPHCWRCDTPLLNYAASSWFVNVTELKPKLLEENSKVMWVPENTREGRFGRWLSGARDWAISRSRYWGAPLPVWKCNKCGNVEVIGSINELKQKTSSGNTYYMMRHGESDNNVANMVCYGIDDDCHLTKKGEDEVVKSAQALKSEAIDIIVSSPVPRAKESALHVAKELGIPEDEIVFDARFSEVHTGVFNLRPVDEYRAYFSSTIEKFTKAPEKGETLSQMKNRLAEGLYDIDARYQGKKILFVTHEYAVWLLEAAAKGLTNQESAALRDQNNDDYVKNAEWKKLDFSPIPHNRSFELDFHRPYIDELSYHCSCELGMMSRIKDVFDCWYESGSMPYASLHYMGDNTTPEGKIFQRNFPADFIAEGLDQTRGWFYSLLVLSVGLFGRSPFKSVIVNGLILAEDGQKMSKKLKNYPDPMMLVKKFGADTLRLYLIGSPVVRAEELRFSEKGVEEIYKKVTLRLDNTWSFYDLHRGDRAISSDAPESLHPLDQWMMSRLSELRSEMTEALDAHELDRAVRPVSLFVDDLSTWYVRRSRDRFKSDDEAVRNDAIDTTGWVLYTFLRLLAPFAPFLTDDLYEKLPLLKKLSSVHLETWPDEIKKDETVLSQMRKVREYVSLGLEKRARAGIKIRQPLASFAIPEELDAQYEEILRDELNVEKIIKSILADREVDVVGVDDVVLDTVITPQLKEKGVLRDILRAIQDMRKAHKLLPTEDITLVVSADKEGEILIKKYADEIRHVTRSLSIEYVNTTEGEQIALDGVSVAISIKR